MQNYPAGKDLNGLLSDIWLIFTDGVNNFAGAWIASGLGQDEYLEVNMRSPWKFTAVHIQGQDGEEQWVTSYKIHYYDDDNATWVEYTDNSGQNVSRFVLLTFSPPITTFDACSFGLLMFLGSLHCKQYGPRRDYSFGSTLICVHIVWVHIMKNSSLKCT